MQSRKVDVICTDGQHRSRQRDVGISGVGQFQNNRIAFAEAESLGVRVVFERLQLVIRVGIRVVFIGDGRGVQGEGDGQQRAFSHVHIVRPVIDIHIDFEKVVAVLPVDVCPSARQDVALSDIERENAER